LKPFVVYLSRFGTEDLLATGYYAKYQKFLSKPPPRPNITVFSLEAAESKGEGHRSFPGA